jgi:hypothetical protein
MADLSYDKGLQKQINELREKLENLEASYNYRFQEDEKKIASLEAEQGRFTSYKIIQNGDSQMKQKLVSPPIVNAGATGNFTAIGTPVGGSTTPPVSWSSDNSLAVVSIDTTDPSGLTVNVAVDPKAPSGSSFNLTVTDASGATGTLNVSIGSSTPPPPTPFTSYSIVQNS